ncbi:MAG: patatin-like phospholipase, partial [Edafosvirus sp.]
SVGALIATLYMIGFSPDEMFGFLKGFDFDKMKSVNLTNFLDKYGFDNGIKLEYTLKRLFNAKKVDPNITFAELYKKTNKTLIIVATCLNDKKSYYFSHETEPDMPVIIALRMSSCIPVYFTPIIYKDMIYIDGGCIDNYPIHLFRARLNEVIGIYLVDTHNTVTTIDNIEEFLIQVVQCLMEGVTFNSTKGFDQFTVKIELDNISIMDLGIDINLKLKMFQSGYQKMIDFFKFK